MNKRKNNLPKVIVEEAKRYSETHTDEEYQDFLNKLSVIEWIG